MRRHRGRRTGYDVPERSSHEDERNDGSRARARFRENGSLDRGPATGQTGPDAPQNCRRKEKEERGAQGPLKGAMATRVGLDAVRPGLREC